LEIWNLFGKLNMDRVEDAERFTGEVLPLAKLVGAKNLGFHLEIMDPGTFSSPYHWHEKEEELCIVIEGEAILRKNNEFKKVRAGDLIFHGTGPESVHHMFNHTDRPFKFFALSSRFPGETCGYPDSNKIYDKASKSITQNGRPVDYWKDEEDPRKHWPAHALRGEVP
jgi:uncharacterized cupin superfamily protein